MADSEIKTLQFNQGQNLALPPLILDDQGTVSLANNTSNQDTGLDFDITVIREVVIKYQVYRYTDTPTELIERGEIRLSAKPQQGVDANKWVLNMMQKNDEGTPSGVTFSKSVASGVVTLLASTSNLAGAGHVCQFRYKLDTLLV